MKGLFWVAICIVNCSLGQLETRNWAVSPNATLQFNSGSVSLIPNSTVTNFGESSCSISDDSGNLLFYSDGFTVWGADNNVLPNGTDLSDETDVLVQSCTQGSLFVQKPESDNIYYLFSLATLSEKPLRYSIVDKNLNGGLGAVVSKNNELAAFAYPSEKMTATKHCNNKDLWLVIVTYKFEGFNKIDHTLEFLSFLITENGVMTNPVKSSVDARCPLLGQMKFNNAGNELAFAETNHLTLFSFDNSTGKVNLKEIIPLDLGNAYGLEYAPNDSLIYINEKQYDFYTGVLTPLLSYNCVGQLQRGLDNKIYYRTVPENEMNAYVSSMDYDANQWIIYENPDSVNHISVIHSPNVSGVGCNLSLEEYNIMGSNFSHVAFPNFPSYHFNHEPSEFTYTGTCVGETFDFFLTNNPTVDSVTWLFHETNSEQQGTMAQFVYSSSGEYQVSCTVYQNGVANTSTQCVNVCGEKDVSIPSTIDLCYSDPQEINALNVCSASYLWNTGDTTSSIFIENEGMYVLETTNACGVFYDTLHVVKSDDCNLLTEIPNVITANDDGVNDVFTLRVKNATSLSYSIVNRWGNEIVGGEIPIGSPLYWNTIHLWDGRSLDGGNVSEGTYFYVLDVELINGTRASKQGFVEVFN